MKAGLISIQPYWLYLIQKGLKPIEVRKTCPKGDVKDWYAYCTKREKDLKKIPAEDREMVKSWFGKVPLKFTLNKVTPTGNLTAEEFEQTCISKDEFIHYVGKAKVEQIWAWHISDLQVFDKPRELGKFYFESKDADKRASDGRKACSFWEFYGYDDRRSYGKVMLQLTRPPQSWQFVEVAQ